MLLRKTTFMFAVLALAGLTLTGCGRKGNLERPGITSGNTKTPAGEKSKGEVVTDRPFLLDPLL